MTAGSNAIGIANWDYAKKAQQYIKLVTVLRSLGAQADIDLPRIAVISNQSAGKSSLVESISGITVPRASGTCTRCPMECRLNYSPGPFKAQVFLRFEKDEDGMPLPETKEVKFGRALDDKSEVEDMLKRAQLAILNPDIPMEEFSAHDISVIKQDRVQQLQFSSNVVCLDLYGPEVTDLSFIDLPGIISNVSEDENPENIELVRSLVKEHIAGNALILLAITMRDDIQNQAAAQLAKEADPQGLRTIGVLTKPDTLQEGEHQSWLGVLSGQTHRLRYGYYVTKQPATRELAEKLTHEGIRQREQDFFSENLPWNKAEASVRGRMGVPNLTRELSKLLSHVIESTLPKLRADSKTSLVHCLKELQELPPPPPEHPLTALLQLVLAFCSDLSLCVHGAPHHGMLIRRCRAAYFQFNNDIIRTAPNFIVEDEGDLPAHSGTYGKYGQAASTSNSFHQRHNSSSGSTLKALLGATAQQIRASQYTTQKSPPTADDADSDNHDALPEIIDYDIVMENIEFKRNPMSLSDVHKLIEKSVTRHLPLTVPHEAKNSLIQECFQEWPDISRMCFGHIFKAFSECLKDLIEEHFEKYDHGGLRERVKAIVERQLEKAKKQSVERMLWMIELENPAFTLNNHYFIETREKYLARFKAARGVKITFYSEDRVSDALSSLSALGLRGLTNEDLHKLHGADKYEQELVLMAEVCAYFKVAFKRIIDNIPRVIDHEFLQQTSKDMHAVLVEGLGMGEHDASQRATVLLSEDPSTSTRREDLVQTRNRLERVIEQLYEFTLH